MSHAWLQDDAEEEEKVKDREPSKDSLYLVIDARRNMWAKNDAGEVYFRNAINVAIHVLKTKIISSEDDLVGVILVGTTKRENKNSFDNVYELLDLDAPSADRIQQLQRMLDEDFDFEGQFGAEPAGAKLPLHHALWACSMGFAAAKVKPEDFKRVWVFTNDDNPNTGDDDLRKQCFQKARDCVEQGQMIMLVPMNPPGAADDPSRAFDTGRFFDRFIPVDDDEEGERFFRGGYDTLMDILSRVRKKEHKKRAYASLDLKITDDVWFSVQVFNNILPAKRPSATFLEAATNAPLEADSRWVCDQTGQVLLDHEFKTYQEYGPGRVYFSKQDMTDIKRVAEPGLRLMGFKPVAALKVTHNLRAPVFLVPNEGGATGSTKAFRALLTKMHEMRRVAIARYVPRPNAAPRFLALMPQLEEVDEDGQQVSPAGLFGISLPYADDIRDLQLGRQRKATPEQVESARAVVQKLALSAGDEEGGADVDMAAALRIPNPVLQKHYTAVQAMALGEEMEWDDARDDGLLPDDEAMKEFEPDIEALASSLGEKQARPVKRKATTSASASGGAAKRSRGTSATAAAAAAAGASVDWDDMITSGKLAKLTIPVLKTYLKAHGLPVGGKKAELISRIEGHHGSK